jgi:hypothetical protein
MLLKLVTLSVAIFELGTTVLAVELRSASNQEILDELSYRLRTGGGGSGGGSRAGYTCDSSSYLHLSVVSPTGSEAQESIYIGNAGQCSSQAQILNTNRSRVNSTTVVAICNSSAYLKRYSITTAGAIAELEQRYIGDMQNCLAQAQSLNSGNLLAPGQAVK